MTQPYTLVNRPAALRNVAAFAQMLDLVVHRQAYLPGMACFYGHSGLGKSRSAVYGANAYRAAYVECGQFTTAKSLLEAVLIELGVTGPRGTVPKLIDQAVYQLALDPTRPLIVDETHHIAHRKFIDVLRELHDKSGAPVVMIGEEKLPRLLEQYERIHNRILVWTAAEPCDINDFRALVKFSAGDVVIAEDLALRIVEGTRGNTRRILTNIAKAVEIAASTGLKEVNLVRFGALVGSSAPGRRGCA